MTEKGFRMGLSLVPILFWEQNMLMLLFLVFGWGNMEWGEIIYSMRFDIFEDLEDSL